MVRNSDYAVQLIDVSKRFAASGGEQIQAVDHLTLDIANGEFFSFLGPSGCGKTTTLRMIAGFEMPSEGLILIGGQSMGQIPPYKRPVNTVFQHYALWPHMTVFENVAFGLEMKKASKTEIQRRVSEALELVQLTGFDLRKPKQLSGGQQQRVALARALVQRPQVLLLDEPLGALDLKLRKAMQLELKHMQQSIGITFVYVTHDQEEALTMSDRIAVMNKGRLEQLGSPKDIYETPVTRYVADFIGETNFLEGRITALDASWATVAVDDHFVVRAPAINHLSNGQTVTLAVRPEKIQVDSAQAMTSECLAGRVEEVVYIGTDTRYLVRLSDQTSVVARVQNVGKDVITTFAPGAEVAVSWQSSAARILTQ
jgi:spermidine/putrescine transport system ATP-binding protein